jgi:predicted Zn-dependent peptidase
VDKAIKGGFRQDELTNSVNSWLEQGKTSLGDNNTVAGILRAFLQNGRDLNEYTEFENKVKALSLMSVNEALRKYFDKSKLVMVYGGDFKKESTEKPAEKKGF